MVVETSVLLTSALTCHRLSNLAYNSKKCRVVLEVEQPRGSSYSLEADRSTGSTYLCAYLYKLCALHICMSAPHCHPKMNKLL